MSKLIVFLGNPGFQYRQTRHNCGWMVCDRLAEMVPELDSWQSKFHGLFTKRRDIVLLKPQTFMNESGVSVQEACRFFGFAPADLIVVHDDIELDFATVKQQLGGGMGGHNGLRSIKQHLGTDLFGRLRIGVGRPTGGIQVADFVLGRFSAVEEAQMQKTLDDAARALMKTMGL